MPLKGLTTGSFSSFPVPRPIAGSGSNIKSTQNGIVNFSAATTANITVSAVDTTKCAILVWPKGGTNTNTSLARGDMTTSTNLQLSTGAASSDSFVWELIEFQNLKSFQSGNFTSSGSGSVVSISSVNLSKSQIFSNYKSATSSTTLTDGYAGIYLSNATTVFISQTGTITKDVNWYVAETY